MDGSISNKRGVWLVLIITMFSIEVPIFNANNVDTDQMPRSVASVLGLHCFLNVLFYVTLAINGLNIDFVRVVN